MKQANAKQKQFMSDIVEFVKDSGWLQFVYGHEYSYSALELHHVTGRASKHNKIPIGHWFIIPVPFELHNVLSDNTLNVTHFKHNFTSQFGSQSHIFKRLIDGMKVNGYEIPPEEVVTAIMDTRK